MVSWYHCQWWLRHFLFGEMNHHGISFAHRCKMLQDATSNWSFLKPLKLVRSLRSAVQRSAAKSTYWLIACFCDSQADKIPRQLGLAWTLHCHRLVSGLAYESSSVGIAVRLSCVGPPTSFDIGKLRSINLSGKQHDFWPFSILVWGPLLRSLAFDPMTCNSFIYIIYIYVYRKLSLWGICESFPSWEGGAFDVSSEAFLAFFNVHGKWRLPDELTTTDFQHFPTMNTKCSEGRPYIWPALLMCSFVSPCRLSSWSRIVEPKDCRSLVPK